MVSETGKQSTATYPSQYVTQSLLKDGSSITGLVGGGLQNYDQVKVNLQGLCPGKDIFQTGK